MAGQVARGGEAGHHDGLVFLEVDAVSQSRRHRLPGWIKEGAAVGKRTGGLGNIFFCSGGTHACWEQPRPGD